NKDEITLERIITAKVTETALEDLGRKFNTSEEYICQKVCSSFGAVRRRRRVISSLRPTSNFLLEDYGIMVNNGEINRADWKSTFQGSSDATIRQNLATVSDICLPLWCNSEMWSNLAISCSFHNGSVSFTLNRANLCISHSSKYFKREKVVILGSVHMFSDQYLDKRGECKEFRHVLFSGSRQMTFSSTIMMQMDPE
ncbi:Intraflagellar transport protein 52, partial [Desmophyllum pertusum]